MPKRFLRILLAPLLAAGLFAARGGAAPPAALPASLMAQPSAAHPIALLQWQQDGHSWRGGALLMRLPLDGAAPLTVAMALDIKAAALLKGFRGGGALDVKALSRCIAGVSRLLADHPEIGNIDINPLILYGKGQGCIAVDAKIEVS